MPFDRPTLPELVTTTEADLTSRLGTTAARLRVGVVDVLARVWAGGVHGLYGYLAWIARQVP
ncbi:hypothetical protein, partial [Roseospirillum parvum]